MTAPPTELLDDVTGLTWSPSGYATLAGPLLGLADAIDKRFVDLAAKWHAEALLFPAFLPAQELHRIDYFGSFPHLATFPVHLATDETNLDEFAAAPVAGDAVTLTRTGPVRDVLTPAACYHLYVHHQGARLAGPRYFTTKATCFRREDHYAPLERQWAFMMREVVCMGDTLTVAAFLDEARTGADELARSLGLPTRWERATDPFFRPGKNPQYLMQKIDPTKQELIFGEGLAIGSVNLHHDHFGRAFEITQPDATPVTTGCLAFGLERWLAAIVRTHGPQPGGWPEVSRD